MRLIDADELKKNFPKDEDWEYPVNTNEYVCGCIDAQPTVDAVPVAFIKGELERLRANRIDADPDDVDYAWDLKMKIEALSDLLGAWEDTYETD